MKLQEYVKVILPRHVVTIAMDALTKVDDPRVDALTLALEHALDRDHHRVSLAAIREVIGDLGQGDALAAIAARLTEPSIATVHALDRWREWAQAITGRSSLEGVGSADMRHEIGNRLAEEPTLRRQRNALLDAVRSSAGDERMTVEGALAWIRGLQDGQSEP
jgi:hypothetical protein